MNKRKNNFIKKFFIPTLIVILVILWLVLAGRAGAASDNKYPRLANVFLKTPITASEAEELANWDVVVLGMQAQDTNPEIFSLLRFYNPDIEILTYLPSAEFPSTRVDILESPNGPWHLLEAGIADQWWLRQSNGTIVSFWAGNQSLNPTDLAPTVNGEKWNTYYPKFIYQNILSTGYWDGVFFDSVWGNAAWVNGGDLDLNNDGSKESASVIDSQWQNGMKKIFSNLREWAGDDIIIMGNGGDDYQEYLNGRMFESFPNQFENGWSGQMPKYQNFMDNGQEPQLSIINGDTENTGLWNNFQDMRYSLASTLMENGFFSYDWGTADHSQLWWYDEYNISLGMPKGSSYLVNNYSNNYTEGLWRRDFDYGTVLVNSTAQPVTADLLGEYEKINGNQDPMVNSGELVYQVVIPAYDGLILLGQLDELVGSSFKNGVFARVFNADGENTRNGFFAYESQFNGGQEVLIQDINNDNYDEYITAYGNRVQIYSASGELINEFFPYGTGFQSEINIAVGDLNNDGWWEIIIVPEAGATTHIKTFSADGRLLNPGFFAYSQSFKGGADVAVADLNGDGTKEIIVGAGEGGGAHIQFFNKDGKLLSPGFFTFESSYRSGLNIAAGDVNGDGKGEIVVSRKKGSSDVQIYDNEGNLLNQWSAFTSQTYNIGVAVSDLDQNGVMEIYPLGSEPFTVC